METGNSRWQAIFLVVRWDHEGEHRILASIRRVPVGAPTRADRDGLNTRPSM
jgi:hypothetical protein